MIRNLLALQHLGLHGSLIDFLARNFSEDEFKRLFNGDTFELQFEYNIFNDEELDIFSNLGNLNRAKNFADDMIETCNKQNVKIISYYDYEYPVVLKNIDKRPLIVYAKGNINLLQKTKLVACVGTRTPTNSAINSVRELVKGLVENEEVIVSGLAKGIDTEAHRACLINKGETIAVLAHGLDIVYPPENKELANEILLNNGVLISEYPLHTKVNKRNFVARNRIVAGMSQGVIVFEADKNSGTMHTARFAFTQGKKIFCPLLFNEEKTNLSTGVVNLLDSNSAYPIKNSSDIINILYDKESKLEKKSISANKEAEISMNTQESRGSKKAEENLSEDTSIDVDLELYNELKALANYKGITIKELISMLFMDYKGKDEGEGRNE